MVTILHRRLNVHTTLSSLTLIRSRGRVNLLSNQRAINSCRNNPTLRSIVRHHLGIPLQFNVRHQDHLIGGRRQHIFRRNPNGHRALTLATKGRRTIFTSLHIRTFKRLNSRIRNMDIFHHFLGIFAQHTDRITVDSIINRNITRRHSILDSLNSILTRIRRLMLLRFRTVSRGLTFIIIVRT